MNVAIIFAGGTGKRMNTKAIPKQFLELHGKPILIYTLEEFEKCDKIDGIIVVCLESWISHCKSLVEKYALKKVDAIIPGGETGLMSRFNGIKKASELYPEDSVCLLHDGVRPLIDTDTIEKDIRSVEEFGSAVTVSPAVETIAVHSDNENMVGEIIDRSKCQLARAPQCFRLNELLKVHEETVSKGIGDCIDTAFLMQQNGYSLYTVEGPVENIKITTPMDFYFFRAVVDMRDDSMIFGV